MNYDIAQALLLFALCLGGLYALFMLLVNLQYNVHRRRRLRLREIAGVLGLEYHDTAEDLDRPALRFREKLRNRDTAWSVAGSYKQHDIQLRPTTAGEQEGSAVYYRLLDARGRWLGVFRPRTPLNDEEVELILDDLLEISRTPPSP